MAGAEAAPAGAPRQYFVVPKMRVQLVKQPLPGGHPSTAGWVIPVRGALSGMVLAEDATWCDDEGRHTLSLRGEHRVAEESCVAEQIERCAEERIFVASPSRADGELEPNDRVDMGSSYWLEGRARTWDCGPGEILVATLHRAELLRDREPGMGRAVVLESSGIERVWLEERWMVLEVGSDLVLLPR